MKRFITLFLSATALIAFLSSCTGEKKTVLFNGKDLDGWVLVANEDGGIPASQVFTVKDGVIRVLGNPFGYMRTTTKFGDYKLHAEWRWVGEPTNSGIFQRIQDGDKVWPSAIEAQLCHGKAGDFVGLNYAKIAGIPLGESQFSVKKRTSTVDPENPVGEWNEADIHVKGTHITIIMNGQLQNEADCDFTEGYIALQSEGGPLEFRNVYVITE